ncbi:hypothetical protein AGMMS49957_12270 [Synergistales bacterium]|nr:hypothetical protein AGMMS49957_12270 [Synergistales bacterium]
MNKKEKKKIISEHIDLAKGRFKDDEVDTLYDLTTNQQKYSGQSKSVKNKFTSWSSDGKYTREEETTYTLKGDDDGVRIEENYKYHDDDGQREEHDTVHNTGRDIINLLKTIFDD